MAEDATPASQELMPLLDHLDELRERLAKSAIALLVCSAACFFVSKPLLILLLAPMGDYPVMAPSPTAAIGAFMKVSLVSGAILATPFIAYQLLCFVTPGLTPTERRSLYWIIPGAAFSFLGGAAFAYFVMMPVAIPFLLGFLSDVIRPNWMIDEYIPFVTSLIFWVGVSFETPLLLYFLARLGLVNAGMLLRGWKFAVVGIAVLAAVITPTPDPFNMILVMLPLLLLYFLGVFLAWVARR